MDVYFLVATVGAVIIGSLLGLLIAVVISTKENR
jgi:hypothetical protein